MTRAVDIERSTDARVVGRGRVVQPVGLRPRKPLRAALRLSMPPGTPAALAVSLCTSVAPPDARTAGRTDPAAAVPPTASRGRRRLGWPAASTVVLLVAVAGALLLGALRPLPPVAPRPSSAVPSSVALAALGDGERPPEATTGVPAPSERSGSGDDAGAETDTNTDTDVGAGAEAGAGAKRDAARDATMDTDEAPGSSGVGIGPVERGRDLAGDEGGGDRPDTATLARESPVSAAELDALVRENLALAAEVDALETETTGLHRELLELELRVAALSSDTAPGTDADDAATVTDIVIVGDPIADDVPGAGRPGGDGFDEEGFEAERSAAPGDDARGNERTGRPDAAAAERGVTDAEAAGGFLPDGGAAIERATDSASARTPIERLVVAEVPPGSVGQGAGLLAGDILLEVDGNEMRGFADILPYDDGSTGHLHELRVLREGQTLPITLGASPAELSLRIDWFDPAIFVR